MSPPHEERTELDLAAHAPGPLAGSVHVQRFALVAVEGPSAGATFQSATDRATVGSHPSNDVVLQDRTVSRFHCEVALGSDGAVVTDVGSRNGTVVDGVRVKECWLREGSMIRLGQTALSFASIPERAAVPLSSRERFGTMVGRSVAMRAAFARLERAAAVDSTVLVEGETGTGKEEAAQSLHEASARAGGPFVVVDCSAIPGALLESELFGHERGAFTGAVARREGAFAAADGGTIFLDEIGELPADLQPKVLRVLERKTVRMVGGYGQVPVDVRIVAATNRNLRSEVNVGRFRPDLYYRLAVLQIVLPPLRQRPDDVPLLVDHLLAKLGADPTAAAALLTEDHVARLQQAAWPGNVRELRNHLERTLAFAEVAPPPPAAVATATAESPGGLAIDPRVSYAEGRERAIEEFERRYVVALLQHHGGNVSLAAREAGMNRAYLHRLLRRHGQR
jgi:DNA-binding NtrC family response regulator